MTSWSVPYPDKDGKNKIISVVQNYAICSNCCSKIEETHQVELTDQCKKTTITQLRCQICDMSTYRTLDAVTYLSEEAYTQELLECLEE